MSDALSAQLLNPIPDDDEPLSLDELKNNSETSTLNRFMIYGLYALGLIDPDSGFWGSVVACFLIIIHMTFLILNLIDTLSLANYGSTTYFQYGVALLNVAQISTYFMLMSIWFNKNTRIHIKGMRDLSPLCMFLILLIFAAIIYTMSAWPNTGVIPLIIQIHNPFRNLILIEFICVFSGYLNQTYLFDKINPFKKYFVFNSYVYIFLTNCSSLVLILSSYVEFKHISDGESIAEKLNVIFIIFLYQFMSIIFWNEMTHFDSNVGENLKFWRNADLTMLTSVKLLQPLLGITTLVSVVVNYVKS
jgi:hypothetical protein